MTGGQGSQVASPATTTGDRSQVVHSQGGTGAQTPGTGTQTPGTGAQTGGTGALTGRSTPVTPFVCDSGLTVSLVRWLR